METTILEITPSVAKSLLEKNKKNRNASKAVINYYADQMARGQWMLTSQGISLDWDGNLLDGQHRLLAVIQSNVTIKSIITTGCDPETFIVLDSNKIRSKGDIFKIENIKNYNNLSSSITMFFSMRKNLGDSAFCRTVASKISKTDLLDFYNENKSICDEIGTFSLKMYSQMRVMSAVTIGGFLIYWIVYKKYPKELMFSFAEKFFINHSDSYLKKAHDFIIKDSMKNVKKFTSSDKLIIISKAWNHYIAGKAKTNKTFLYIQRGDNVDTLSKYL